MGRLIRVQVRSAAGVTGGRPLKKNKAREDAPSRRPV